MKFYLFILTALISLQVHSQVHDKSWRDIIYKGDEAYYKTSDVKQIADNVLLYQRDIGGWPKNIQMQEPLSNEDKQKLRELKSKADGATTDNGATYQEMLFLSKVYRHFPEERYKQAFLDGLNYLLKAQYDNGGWPQFYPYPENKYYSHITYNDDSMVNIMKVLQEIKNRTDYYSIAPSEETIQKAEVAFNKGIDCIIKTQYVQNGKLTAWCAQHDEVTLQPAKARAYELPSLSGKESAKIVLLLMSLDNPSPEVIRAVTSAHDWFERVKITGLREERVYNEKGKVIDKKMVADADAPPLWARFMELHNNTPFFCDRDGIKKYSLDEIGAERRNGYAWYTNEPKEVLKKFDRWAEAHNVKKNDDSQQTTPEDPFNVTVAADGSGDYRTVQEAINNSKSFPYEKITIFIKNGIYKEKVKVHEWNTNITLVGESKEQTIITYDDYFNKVGMGRNSTFYTYTLLVEADDFIAKNLTIENSSGDVGQAVALSVFSNRVAIVNCRILGNQDTLYASGNGRQYFKDCYIEGTTDFIFGSATAFFDNCTINSKKNSYITAASTPKDTTYGYVFKNCKITADADVSKVYLGRPWRIYAKTVFIDCDLGNHILPEGWHNWDKPEAEQTSFYAEYQNKGDGFQPKQRVLWSYQLKASEAKQYTLETVLGETNKSSKKQWYEGI
ncbi:pectate lyase [Subsaxibacter sp. CAU 1640]|uniref:pectate lyase n=1 Tax=Subsaxibacter sp. CAU 1640 TaxID=2933271 RepID=UPI002004F7F9|nr:pectate lyase [Subsaxibacter sp. CAU 1640]MCK7589068.1 pectate lyase [Subsaxibacter sp. CAU 1640]